jgi:hypothetical protein
MNSDDIKKVLENDLREYINNPSSVKAYTQHIQEMNKWLSELKK